LLPAAGDRRDLGRALGSIAELGHGGHVTLLADRQLADSLAEEVLIEVIAGYGLRGRDIGRGDRVAAANLSPAEPAKLYGSILRICNL
jgi:hypothetical protein